MNTIYKSLSTRTLTFRKELALAIRGLIQAVQDLIYAVQGLDSDSVTSPLPFRSLTCREELIQGIRELNQVVQGSIYKARGQDPRTVQLPLTPTPSSRSMTFRTELMLELQGLTKSVQELTASVQGVEPPSVHPSFTEQSSPTAVQDSEPPSNQPLPIHNDAVESIPDVSDSSLEQTPTQPPLTQDNAVESIPDVSDPSLEQPSVQSPLSQDEDTESISGDSDSNPKITTQSFLESATPIQQSLLGSYVLIHMQVLVGILRRQPRQLDEVVAGFQQTSLYSQWCEVIEQDSDLSQRWSAILDHSGLRTNQACDEYALKCHQLYEVLINVLYQTQEGAELPPVQLQLRPQNLICSYILNYMQILICGLSTHPSKLDEAIAAFKNMSIYTQCCEFLKQSPTLWQRWDSTLAPATFSSEAECEVYSSACHQLYYELVDDPIKDPDMVTLSPDLRLTYQHWICSYVLTHIQVLISVYHDRPKRLSEAIATFKATPLYTKCCEVLETSPAAWQRWNSTLTPATLTTEAECEAYALACHQLYSEIMG